MTQNQISGLLSLIANILSTRILCAALVVSVFIALIAAARKRLPLVLRSWLWGAAFIGLLFPFERFFSILLADYNLGLKSSAIIRALAWSPLFSAAAVIKQAVPLIWPAGVLYFAVKSGIDAHRTRRLLFDGKVAVCAAYFYRGRSHIYLPQDFDTAYTSGEQELLLAHEKQHIAQHDPLLYRLLPIAQCVFWFCPAVHKAARLFQRDRELLCDRRVTQDRSEREYSILLLKAACKKPVGRMASGIVSEEGGVKERVERFAMPVRASRTAAAAALLGLTALLCAGMLGLSPVLFEPPTNFLKVTVTTPSHVLPDDATDWKRVQSMERFVLFSEEGATLDQAAMHGYALAIGLAPEQQLTVTINSGYRPILFRSGYFHSAVRKFKIEELLTQTISLSYNEPAYRIRDLVLRHL